MCEWAVDVAAGEKTGIELRREWLDATVDDLRKAGVTAHLNRGEAGFAQRLVGAAGRQQFDAAPGEFAGELDDAGFVGNGEQRAADRRVERGGHRRFRREEARLVGGVGFDLVHLELLAKRRPIQSPHPGGASLIAVAVARKSVVAGKRVYGGL